MNMNRSIKNLFLIVLLLLTAITVSSQKRTRVPTEKDMSAYLMVYFKDNTHGLYMALSKDGNVFTDVNQANPVISADTVAQQQGIRDPYIVRGKDGLFYMAMTDLHIFAEKLGYRTTEWERDGSKYGWGNNRAIVLMKSKDLINWSHTVLRVDKSFDGLSEIGCAWAPELIFDEQKDKMMIYFTMRFGNGKNMVYYSYLNEDFSGLETMPKLLFDYPKNVSCIDADITKVNGKFHLFYVPHDGTPGIKQMVSDSINSAYQYQETWVDLEPGACEAPSVYKRINQNTWVLIYDIYSINPHNFGFTETKDFVNFKNLGHFNQSQMKATNFSSPKHPSVIHLTAKEAQLLTKYWHSRAKPNSKNL
jgi:hypothetical protein